MIDRSDLAVAVGRVPLLILLLAFLIGLLGFCAGHLVRGALSSHGRFKAYGVFFGVDRFPDCKDGPKDLLAQPAGLDSFSLTGRCEPRCVSLAM